MWIKYEKKDTALYYLFILFFVLAVWYIPIHYMALKSVFFEHQDGIEWFFMLVLTNIVCYIMYLSVWDKKQAYCYKIVLCEDYLDYSGIRFHRKINYKDIMDIEIHSLYIRKSVKVSCIRIETKKTYIYCYCEHLPKEVIEEFINSIKHNICK